MRIAAALLLVIACRAAPPPPAPVIANTATTPTCSDAAARLARGAADPADPDVDLFSPLRAHCEQDAWPGAARACFAAMRETELGQCAAELSGSQRAALFDVLSGGTGDRGQLALARARLQGLAVGLDACDRYIAHVATALGCEAMPLDERLSLGRETASMWDVTRMPLHADDRLKLGAACDESLAYLERQELRVGCTP